MRDIWDRIEIWLQLNAPQVLQSLQPGASDEQIRAAEEFLSIELPEEVKASLRIHNGQVDSTFGFYQGCEFLSLERIRSEWQVWKELLDSGDFNGIEGDPQPGINSSWWDKRWIPLTHDGSGNHHCLDLNPAPGGTVGQIITMWHDDPTRSLIANSFRAWLTDYAAGLEAGKYAYSEKYSGIINANEL